jgi:hypothetical protein
MFGNSEDFIVRKNLRASLGEKNYNKLMGPVNKLVRAGHNASNLLGGSQTAQLESYKIPYSKKRFIRSKIGKLLTIQSSKKYEDIAKMLKDPKYLKTQVEKYNLSEQKAYKKMLKTFPQQLPKIGGILEGGE